MPEPLELWGGAECTVNRVGDRYLDQTLLTGHQDRPDDLDRIAALGVRALRYPVLWERTAPHGPDTARWEWPDARLDALRAHGIRPIVGLVHHGSGPLHTNLLDERFPSLLEQYARTVAERYPWVEDYTPVNEPLTTARFSALYGLWYPHRSDVPSFIRALVIQCRAVVLAMRAIRAVTPTARLVQTDDLGRTHSTPTLRYQADLENHRRWLGWDLLCGRIDRTHPLWDWLTRAGEIPPDDLLWFRENPCPPDILGINHYLSSERFLDEEIERYPPDERGGNGRHRYADVLAARVLPEGGSGPAGLLREAWDRYHIPIAVTECHNGCTREEQLRWFLEVWDAAENLRAQGVDIRAVTVWSLMGVHGWNTLVTGEGGVYEPGVFDARSDPPRPTALAPFLRGLADGTRPSLPFLDAAGWWRSPARFLYGHTVDHEGTHRPALSAPSVNDRYPDLPPLLITGATGTLGAACARFCELRGLPYRLLRRGQMDIADPRSVEAALDRYQPWAVVNTAGYVRVDDAEREPERCMRENTEGPAILAAACAARSLPLVTFSSDLVFDGSSTRPYVESDPVHPLNVYGSSKAEAERRVLALHPDALVIRTSAFFGPWDEFNFVTNSLRALERNEEVQAADDQIVSPTYVPDLVTATLDLLIDGEHGLWHLANPGSLTWASLAQLAAQEAGITTGRITPVPTHLPAARPRMSALGSQHGLLLPPLEDALARYLADRRAHLQTAVSLQVETVDAGTGRPLSLT